MSKEYKIYEGYPTFKEIKKQFNDFISVAKDITTIEQAQEYRKTNRTIVEINGDSIDNYIKDNGINSDIEWIRYEEYSDLAYIYCEIRNGKVDHVRLDIYSEWLEAEFITDVIDILSQDKYYKELQRSVDRWGNECKQIGIDNEDIEPISLVL